jgi:hypothetical protein
LVDVLSKITHEKYLDSEIETKKTRMKLSENQRKLSDYRHNYSLFNLQTGKGKNNGPVLQEYFSNKDPNQLKQVTKYLETKCPQCKEILNIKLDENDLESIANGIHLLHKIVEHGMGVSSHAIDLYIDSDFNVRRKSTVKLVRAHP